MQGILRNHKQYWLILIGLIGQIWGIQAQVSSPKEYDSLRQAFSKATSYEQQVPILTALSKLPTSTRDSLTEQEKFQKYAYFSKNIADKSDQSDWELKYMVLRNAGRFFQKYSAYDSAMMMYESAVQTAYQVQDSIKAKYCRVEMGHYAKSSGKLPQALSYYQEALRIAEICERNLSIAEIKEYIGDIQVVLGNYDKASEHFNLALQIRKEENDMKGIVLLQNRIGELYLKWYNNNTKQAKHFFEEALALSTENNFELGQAYAFRNMGKLYEKMNENDSALVYYERAYARFTKFRKTKEQILCHIYRGGVYIKKEKFDRADLFFRNATTYARRANERYLEARAEEGLARNYLVMNKFVLALRTARISLLIAEKDGYLDIIRDNYLNMSKVYEHRGNHKIALEYYQQYVKTKDKIFFALNDSKLAGMRASSEMSKTKEENLNLKAEQELQSKQLKSQRIQITTMGLAFIFAVVFTIALVYTLRQRNQALVTLKIQNKQIDSQYKIIAKEKQKTDEAYQQLQLSQAQLLQSEKMASLGQLTAGVAHEFNNPINFISSASETLEHDLGQLLKIINQQADLEQITNEKEYEKELQKLNQLKTEMLFDELPDDILEAIDDIRNGSERVTKMVKGLNTFSRLDQNTPKAIDLHENLDATLTMLRHLREQIDIQKVYAQNLPKIECIPGEINQVFLSILSNAIQAVDKKIGRIKLETKHNLAHNCVTISIIDNGVGIKEHHLSKIFEPFYTTREVGEGTGLGLFTAHQIIQNHGGKIEVQSKPKEGTTVILSLFLDTKFEDKLQ